MSSRALTVAAVLGIGVPGATLLLFGVLGWTLPTWLAVALPIVLIGSLRGTLVLLAWKLLRRLWPRLAFWRGERSTLRHAAVETEERIPPV